MNITDIGSASQDVNPFYFQLTSSSNAVYSTAFAAGAQNNLQAVTLNSGQHVSGQIAFKVANGETPSKLVFSQLYGITVTVTNIPASSGVVSYVEGGSAVVKGTYSTYVSASVSVINSSSYFYTGQVIAVQIAINNFLSGSNITVTGITDSDTGLTTKGLAQSLPLTVGSSEVDVTLYLVATSTVFNGQLMNMTVTTS